MPQVSWPLCSWPVQPAVPPVSWSSVAFWLSAFVRLCFLSRSVATAVPFVAMSRGERLRQLAEQLASLASLEDTVTQGLSTFFDAVSARTFEVPAETSRPRSRSRSRSRSLAPLPKRARARRDTVSPLISHGGSATGLGVKFCPPAPPGRTRLSCIRHDAEPAPVSLEPAEPARASSIMTAPSALDAPDSSTPSLAQQARQAQPDTTEGRRGNTNADDAYASRLSAPRGAKI